MPSIAFVDVHYEGAGGVAACVVVADWSAATAIEERVATVPVVKPYQPGAFYERELPCIAAVLSLVRTPLDVVVVDGYVELDDQGTPGLGAHLHAHLGGNVPVVGVAKTAFRGATFAVRVTRGNSKSPLFVTARGVSASDAALHVKQMHGPHRIPTLLARVDGLARGRFKPQ